MYFDFGGVRSRKLGLVVDIFFLFSVLAKGEVGFGFCFFFFLFGGVCTLFSSGYILWLGAVRPFGSL